VRVWPAGLHDAAPTVFYMVESLKGLAMVTELIEWRPATDPPDDDCVVLVHVPLASEPVWLAYLNAGVWRWASGGRIEQPVERWTELPRGSDEPTREQIDQQTAAWAADLPGTRDLSGRYTAA
jgi:hypothetical protein